MEQIKHSPNHDEMIPLKFQLSQNYPNPFKEKTRIKFCIPYKTEITITILNSKGNIIKKLLEEKKDAGTYEIEFDGSELPAGIYNYTFIACEFEETKKMKILE
jgi:flagellar hook assembly protein FlgD